MARAWVALGLAGSLAACSGEAVIGGEGGSSGAGGNQPSGGAPGVGGFGNGDVGSGAAGSGGRLSECERGVAWFLEVQGDGPDQLYEQNDIDWGGQQLPMGFLAHGKGGPGFLQAQACLDAGQGTSCMSLSSFLLNGVGEDGAASFTYVDATNNPCDGEGGAKLMIDIFESVGERIVGNYDGTCFYPASMNSRSLHGSFTLCRSPDRYAP